MHVNIQSFRIRIVTRIVTMAVSALFFFGLWICVFAPHAAEAACTSPTGSDGQINYYATYDVMQYCNNTSWQNMGVGAYHPQAVHTDITKYMQYSPSASSTKTITGITKASPGSVTATAHGFSTNDVIHITGVVGMTQVNGRDYTITSTGANTFTIGVSTSGYSNYTSGGSAAKYTWPIADSKKYTMSFWWYPTDVADWQYVLDFSNELASGSNAFDLFFRPDQTRVLSGINYADDGTYGDTTSMDTTILANRWYHFLFSIDTSQCSNNRYYINDQDQYETNNNNCNANVLFNFTAKTILLINSIAGYFADVWVSFGTYVDFSVEANRRKFITASGMPVYLGTNGALPTGTQPQIFYSGDTTGWTHNKGSMGDFTVMPSGSLFTTPAWDPATLPVGINPADYAGCKPRINNAQRFSSTTATTGYTLSSYAVPSLSNTILVVAAIADAGTGAAPSTVTFNGTGLTSGVSSTQGTTNTSLWYLLAPTATTANIVATWGSNRTDVVLIAYTLSCVAQQAPSHTSSATGTATGASYTLSASVTPNANYALVLDAVGSDWCPVNGFTEAGSNRGPYIVTATATNNELRISGASPGIFNGCTSDGTSGLLGAAGEQLVATAASSTGAWTVRNASTMVIASFERASSSYNCQDPDGNTGMIYYDTTNNLMKYCNGMDWVAMATANGAGGTGCTSPSGSKGGFNYNTGTHVLKYCEGTNWITLGY